MNIEPCLICECHLVDLDELKLILKDAATQQLTLTKIEDLKRYRIIGHGCGQCLKTWETELQELIDQYNV